MASHAELIGTNRLDRARVYLIEAELLSELPSEFEVERPYALLLAGDASRWDEELLQGLVRRWIGSGLAYACCWGDGCEWVHDQIDEADRALGGQPPGALMTSWHDGQPISDAVGFVADLAVSDGSRFSPIKARVVAIVGDASLAGDVKREFVAHLTQ